MAVNSDRHAGLSHYPPGYLRCDSEAVQHRAEKTLVIVIAIVAVLAVGAGVVAAGRGSPRPAAGTPQATVQTYLIGVLERDLSTAADALDPMGPCDLTDLQRVEPQGVTRAVLGRTTTGEKSATVRVDLVYEKSGGRFGGSWVEPLTFSLTRTDGSWVITGQPWPLFDCGAGWAP